MKTQKKEPVYRTISDDLRSKIFSGTMKPGTALPSESQLCQHYGAARETVRKGLRELEKAGLIYTRPKVGWFVARPNYTNFRLGFSDEFQNCRSTYQRVAIQSADAEMAKRLNIKEQSLVIALEVRHFLEDDTTVSIAHQYLPYSRGNPSLERAMMYTVIPNATLSKMETYQVFSKVTISAKTAGAELAELMGCTAEEPLLELRRTYFEQNGQPIAYEVQYCLQPIGMLSGIVGMEKTPG